MQIDILFINESNYLHVEASRQLRHPLFQQEDILEQKLLWQRTIQKLPSVLASSSIDKNVLFLEFGEFFRFDYFSCITFLPSRLKLKCLIELE